tara:strand:- start:192 stop:323 length:132 start_codon:yes stop_codon:yes gene_type:complete
LENFEESLKNPGEFWKNSAELWKKNEVSEKNQVSIRRGREGGG